MPYQRVKVRKGKQGRPAKADIEISKKIADLYINPDGTARTPTEQEITKQTLPATIGYSEELMESIMAHVAAGKSVESFASHPGMPHTATVYRWIDAHEKWQERYKIANQTRARSRIEQAEQQADQMLRDDNYKAAGMYEARIRALTRLAAIGDPMRYSDKMLHLHHHTGELALKLEFDLGEKVGTARTREAEDIIDSES